MHVLSAHEAARHVRDRDTVAVPLGPGIPPAFLEALGERERFDDLVVFAALLLAPYALLTRPGVRLLSGFFGPVERALAAAGHDVHFIPADFRRFASLAERLRPRVMATAVAPSDTPGQFSLGLHAGATVDALRRCGRDPERLLIAELNRQLPSTKGLPPEHPHALLEDEIDLLVEVDVAPFVLADGPGTDVDRAIAEHALRFIPDGATLQIGIGGIPNAVVQRLADGGGGDYGIHTEMFTTGLMQLTQAGKVTNRKGLYDGVSTTTFSLGSEELYRWLDGGDDVRFLPVEAINAPAQIARNRRFISLNGALEVDLGGQLVADTRGGAQFSGIGGHEDFIAGAAFSEQGRSLVCLPSTATVGGELVSRIRAVLRPGTSVTTPRHQVDTIITEYGAAELFGRTVAERREALIAIAHPDFRAELRKAEAP